MCVFIVVCVGYVMCHQMVTLVSNILEVKCDATFNERDGDGETQRERENLLGMGVFYSRGKELKTMFRYSLTLSARF